MCSLCKSYPCLRRCPNSPEPESVGKCGICKDDIRVGDAIVNIHGDLFHFECVEDLGTMDILEMFDIAVEEAGG